MQASLLARLALGGNKTKALAAETLTLLSPVQLIELGDHFMPYLHERTVEKREEKSFSGNVVSVVKLPHTVSGKVFDQLDKNARRFLAAQNKKQSNILRDHLGPEFRNPEMVTIMVPSGSGRRKLTLTTITRSPFSIIDPNIPTGTQEFVGKVHDRTIAGMMKKIIAPFFKKARG